MSTCANPRISLETISLSLPRDGRATRRAASSFLENLLPDEEHTRFRMSQTYEASGTGTFALLEKAGGDVAVSKVAEGVAAVNDTAWIALDDDQAVALRDAVARNVDRALS